MKKFVALLLAVLMVASLCACGQKDTQTGSDIKTVTAGKLTMSTNAQFPPYESVADDGKGYEGTGFEGIDIEIAYALAQKLGLELVVDDMDFDSALSAVQTGKSDIVAAGVTVTPELIKEVKPDHVIVATGAHFVKPNIPGLDTAEDVFVAEDVLAGKAMPHGETIILGGGGVGCGDDIVDAANAGADAVACAAVLHYKKETVTEMKEDIRAGGVEVRQV